MSSTREQISPRGKRQRKEAGTSLDESSESRPSKRQKLSIKLHSAEFYDSLSKVWLTRRALKELNRRTSQVSRPQRPVSAPPHVYRGDTSKHLQRFARHGGPELRDLRGYPTPRTMSPRHSSDPSGSKPIESTVPRSTSSKTRRSSAYNNDFEQHLTDNRIYIRNRKSKPGLEGFYEALQRPRPSLSPSRFPDDAFEGFQQKNEDVIDEGDVMRNVVPTMCGNADIPSRQNLLFTRLDPIANDTTVVAKPDFYDGARLEDIDKQVRQDLGSYIIPTGHTMAPAAPNFFLEVKRPSGGADVAKRQACYDGALGARGMHQLQSYKQEPIYDGNAYTITSTYHDGTLKMYTTHLTQAVDGTTAYHMTQIDGWNLTGNPNTCRQGLTHFRNGRDWAQEQRDAFISAANERASSTNAEPPPSESFDHNDCSDPTGVQDISNLTQAEDPVDGPQYHMSQQDVQGRYNREPLNSASEFNDTHTAETQEAANSGAGYICTDTSTLELSDYNDNSDTTAANPVEESQTSADEIALDTYAQPKASNKRRRTASEKTFSKAPRKSDGRSSRRGSKR